jgi:hypothetical protein
MNSYCVDIQLATGESKQQVVSGSRNGGAERIQVVERG